MKRKQVVLLALLAGLAAFVVWLAFRNPKPPFLPRDEVHASFANADTCLMCHGPGGVKPQSEKHPVGRDCTRCHAWR